MTPISTETALARLRWRYAVKQFDPARTIDPATWAALEDSLVLAPSSYGLQPWKFFVVESPAVRERLLEHSWGQRQVVEASHLVVFAVKENMNASDAERLVRRMSEVRGVPVEALEGYRGMMAGSLSRSSPAEIDTWMSRQVFIALGQFLATCAMVGVDACPMEGFVPAKYDEILGLPAKGYASRVVATVGYRSPGDKTSGYAKVRYPKEELIERL
jgi:nitroreductase